MSTIPITKRGAEMLKEELHRLKTKERPDVVNAIAEARAQGDLSENADYDAAKERQGFIEGRIQEIESKLSAAQIIDPASLDADGRVVLAPPSIWKISIRASPLRIRSSAMMRLTWKLARFRSARRSLVR